MSRISFSIGLCGTQSEVLSGFLARTKSGLSLRWACSKSDRKERPSKFVVNQSEIRAISSIVESQRFSNPTKSNWRFGSADLNTLW